ncbi:Methionyl-tRNA formyltransferase [Alphaproteobacteria bacterium SO-S41]|nr:Methionyl-tRNA formyltransferase [Alphaproteobacteria bacterium SO-S41]
MALRLAFMGTPGFSVAPLAQLISAGHEIAAVYSQPPRPSGRGHAETKSAVHDFAEKNGIPVRTPKSLRNAEAQAAFAALELDAAVVVAYGLILPKPILEAPRLGCINIHASLLPRWRGAAPIQRAIMAGDDETGVMTMQMDEGLDTGPVLMAERIAITPDMTAGQLHDALSPLGADLIVRTIAALERGTITARPQAEDGTTYAAKISKDESRLDWSRPADELRNRIRGLAPAPGAWAEIKGERIKILKAALAEGSGTPGAVLDDRLTIACGDGALRLETLQRPGRGPMAASDLLRGFTVARGDRLP